MRIASASAAAELTVVVVVIMEAVYFSEGGQPLSWCELEERGGGMVTGGEASSK